VWLVRSLIWRQDFVRIKPKGSHPGKTSLLSFAGDGTGPPAMYCGLCEILLLHTSDPEGAEQGQLPLLFLLGWRTLGLPGEADSVKICALLD
jgi:hypothetical protein